MNIRIVLLAVASLGLASCEMPYDSQTERRPMPAPVGDGNPESLRVGMSKSQVRALLGHPDDTTVTSRGTTWTYKETAKMFIPYYMMAGGRFRTTTIYFSNSGYVTDFESSNQGMY
jgi:outer membrane protein assembly factor BamE (lipoprotein component of BamABCDE complex)